MSAAALALRDDMPRMPTIFVQHGEEDSGQTADAHRYWSDPSSTSFLSASAIRSTIRHLMTFWCERFDLILRYSRANRTAISQPQNPESGMPLSPSSAPHSGIPLVKDGTVDHFPRCELRGFHTFSNLPPQLLEMITKQYTDDEGSKSKNLGDTDTVWRRQWSPENLKEFL